jgi:hypothetical protein
LKNPQQQRRIFISTRQLDRGDGQLLSADVLMQVTILALVGGTAVHNADITLYVSKAELTEKKARLNRVFFIPQ